MEFIEFDATTKKTKITKEPFITISSYGCIRFNSFVSECLKLTENTKVSFLQDKNNPKDWYLKLDTINGIKLKTSKKDKSFHIQFREVTNAILKSLDKTKTIKIRISTQIHDGMYCLITNAIK